MKSVIALVLIGFLLAAEAGALPKSELSEWNPITALASGGFSKCMGNLGLIISYGLMAVTSYMAVFAAIPIVGLILGPIVGVLGMVALGLLIIVDIFKCVIGIPI